ncbi:MAG: 30S ribosomal protein S28e [Candidatus Nanoarchaeia archaeon]
MPKKIIEKKAEEAGGVKETTSAGAGGEVVPAQILELVGSMGTREGGRQVRVKLLAGKEAGKIMRRNVIGPFRIGDIIMLRETEIEASPVKGRKR